LCTSPSIDALIWSGSFKFFVYFKDLGLPLTLLDFIMKLHCFEFGTVHSKLKGNSLLKYIQKLSYSEWWSGCVIVQELFLFAETYGFILLLLVSMMHKKETKVESLMLSLLHIVVIFYCLCHHFIMLNESWTINHLSCKIFSFSFNKKWWKTLESPKN
jgi:hypothetical protein